MSAPPKMNWCDMVEEDERMEQEEEARRSQRGPDHQDVAGRPAAPQNGSSRSHLPAKKSTKKPPFTLAKGTPEYWPPNLK